MKIPKQIIFIIIFFSAVSIYPQTVKDLLTQKPITTDSVIMETSSTSEATSEMRDYLKAIYPIISDKWIDEILSSGEVESSENEENTPSSEFVKVKYLVPKCFLVDTAKILWELNIPEFRSYLYALYRQDTILIDIWNNVVGKSDARTNPGMFEAYRIRNWPYWKDPEKPESEPTPPGPNNPLGLFVVHYDETSLRYFHGTNQNNLIYSQMRNISHGCVRNDNKNIQKMKEFIIGKVIKSTNLSDWLNSKNTLSYDLKPEEKFPVRILYKTYTVLRDDGGVYIELFKDIYGFSKTKRYDNFTDPDYIFFSTKENILNEYKNRIHDNDIPDEKLLKAIDYVLVNSRYYYKYYLSDIFSVLGD